MHLKVWLRQFITSEVNTQRLLLIYLISYGKDSPYFMDYCSFWQLLHILVEFTLWSGICYFSFTIGINVCFFKRINKARRCVREFFATPSQTAIICGHSGVTFSPPHTCKGKHSPFQYTPWVGEYMLHDVQRKPGGRGYKNGSSICICPFGVLENGGVSECYTGQK